MFAQVVFARHPSLAAVGLAFNEAGVCKKLIGMMTMITLITMMVLLMILTMMMNDDGNDDEHKEGGVDMDMTKKGPVKTVFAPDQ